MNEPDGGGVHIDPRVGLCVRCQYGEVVTSAKGSTFHLCRLSATDPAFPKYPRLPVLSCRGFIELVAAPRP